MTPRGSCTLYPVKLVQHKEAVINALDFQAIKDLALPRKNHRSLSPQTDPLWRPQFKRLPCPHHETLKKILQGAASLKRLNLSYCPVSTDNVAAA